VVFLAAFLAALSGEGVGGSIARDARLYATAPVRWEAGEWALFGAALGTTGLLTLADRPVRSFALDHQSPGLSRGADVVRQFGNGWWTVPPLGVLWGAGIALEAPREQRVAREGMEAMAFSAVVSQALKYSIGRERPAKTDDPYRINADRANRTGLAMPSGHSQAAWSVLSVVALEYQDVPGVAPIAYGAATLCALSRVYDNRHWTSDVFAGSALGFASAWAVVHWNRSARTTAAPPALGFAITF